VKHEESFLSAADAVLASSVAIRELRVLLDLAAWLAPALELGRRFPVAGESEEADVRKLRDELGLPFEWAMGTPEMVRTFDDVTAVPTPRLFDRRGRAAGAFYGAPPELHGLVETKLRAALEAGFE